jgi:curved DNA-binding protein CbpA
MANTKNNEIKETFDHSSTLYDLLEIDVSASQEEVEQAYLRLSFIYNTNNMALHSMLSVKEIGDMQQKMQDAYRVLSHVSSRKEYDAFLNNEGNTLANQEEYSKLQGVFAEVPAPMDMSSNAEELLVSPATDFSIFEYKDQVIPEMKSEKQILDKVSEAAGILNRGPKEKRTAVSLDGDLLEEIRTETHFHGDFLQKIRKAYRISIEELSSITKISKNYLMAIEEENFKKLPAPVYIRGFVIQIAQVLKLPTLKVASAYLVHVEHSLKKLES